MTSSPSSSGDVLGRLRWIDMVGVGALAVVFSGGQAILDRQPLLWDEYYHLLAGRSWAADGTYSVGDGFYARAAWLSAAVGWIFRTFGEGVAQARVVPAAVHATVALVVFIWLCPRAGRLAAWSASLMIASSPIMLVNSVMVRFYGIAALLVVLCAIALDAASRGRNAWGWRLAALSAAVACAWTSYRITPLTRIWVSGLLVWAGAMAVLHLLRSRHRIPVLTASVLALSAGLWTLWHDGWISGILRDYRTAPGWSLHRADDLAWYVKILRSDYPTLLTLFPLGAILAVKKSPRVGSLCLTAFVVGFAALSGAGPKAERYALPVLSFFFIVWGLALGELVPALRRWLADLVYRVLGDRPASRTRRLLPTVLVLGVIGFVMLTNSGFTSIRHWADGRIRSLDRPGLTFREWEQVSGPLRSLMDEVDVVVTANTVQMLYHVGMHDYGMHPTVIAELVPPRDFGIDPREGRPTISTLESLRRVVSNHETGLIVGERWRWGSATDGFTSDVAGFIYDTMEEVPFPATRGLIVYRWGGATPPASLDFDPADIGSLPGTDPVAHD